MRLAWFIVSFFIYETAIPFPSGFKSNILRLFGSRVGYGVVIKPNVKIKYPWLLSIGNNSWIGEFVWIDNLAQVSIGSNCCISQGAYLLTGNHDYRVDTFDLMVKEIKVKDGSWVCAKAVICPGVTLGKGSILSVCSLATNDLIENGIYQGVPAVLKKMRYFK
ncbi:WcaF family extracellular polysaccharide biosynthesis acetyltransferase [Vibrio vulnificus]|nr:WcaF family extracellular polysaccharide biosynthesis acetyltransferase [Vibrio vulnificus]